MPRSCSGTWAASRGGGSNASGETTPALLWMRSPGIALLSFKLEFAFESASRVPRHTVCTYA